MITTSSFCQARSILVVLALSVFPSLGNTAGSPAEACEKKAQLQEIDETKGIHDFNVCQLVPGIDVPASERPGRICTAHLALVEGHGQVIVPATCFLPAPEQNGIYLQKQEKGWAFNGKLSLMCGPHMYSFDMESTFKDPKVLLHPKFIPEKKFAQLHNFAVVRIGPEDYAKADAHSAAWEFARLSEPLKEPGIGDTCRCYAGTSGAPGGAEPPEYQVESCRFTDAQADVKQHACFSVKKSENAEAEFKELDSITGCDKKYCGIRQTMACFRGTTADELRNLYSIGSYVWAKTEDKVSFYSSPLKDNWEFLRSSVHESGPLGATDAQLEDVRTHLSQDVGKCFAGKDGAAMKSFVKQHLCETTAETASKTSLSPEFRDGLKKLYECVNARSNDPSPPQPDTNKGRELSITPFEQAVGLAFLVADEKVCAKSKIAEVVKGIRRKLKRKLRCFSLVFRKQYAEERRYDNTFNEIFRREGRLWLSVFAGGIVPGAIGWLIGYGCCKIGHECDPDVPTSKFYRPCMVISTLFLSTTYLVDGLITSTEVGAKVAVSAVKAAVPATKAANAIGKKSND